jgi:predicted kinase
VSVDLSGQWLVVVSGWTGAGKSTMAERLGDDLDATVASFDCVMSGLRAAPKVWAHVELPVERQRRVGWNLLSRVAEQQLRRGSSCILDLVAREEPIREWRQLADSYGASFGMVECICSDLDVHRSRVDGRERQIPGWYELDWDRVQKDRELYEPLSEPKIVVDAIASVDKNLERVRRHLSERNRSSAR